MAKDVKEIYGLEALFTGSCNMKCSYCYIHKNPKAMKEYNNALRDSIINGEFQNKIINTFENSRETLNSLSLWGGEPTVNSDLFEEFSIPIFDYFSKIDKLMISTNAKMEFNKGLFPFFDSLKRYCQENKRKIKFTVQFSLDGPEWISEKTRSEEQIVGKILDNIHHSVLYAAKNCDEYFRLCFIFKPTISSFWWEYILDNNLLEEWFLFFNNIQKKYLSYQRQNEYFQLNLTPEPTLVIPDNFTKKDGILYTRWIKECIKIERSGILDAYHAPTVRRYINVWMDSIGALEFSKDRLKCSAGLTTYSINYLGEIMACHRNYDNYSMGEEREAFLKNELINPDKNNYKIDYTTAIYQSSHKFKEEVLRSEITALVSSGEIDKKYLKTEYLKILYVFLGALVCPYGEYAAGTGDLYMITLGYIRLLCNGALEELIKYHELYL